MKYKEKDIEMLEKHPTKVPSSVNIKGNKVYKTCKWCSDHDRGNKVRNFYRTLDRFLMSNLGRNINKVFSDFCRKFPERIADENTRQAFRERVYEEERWRWYKYHNTYFYVDSQNRLSFDWKLWNKRHKSIPFILTWGETETRYEVNLDFLRNNPDLMDDIARFAGYAVLSKVLTGNVDEKTYQTIASRVGKSWDIKARKFFPDDCHVRGNIVTWYCTCYDLLHKIFKHYVASENKVEWGRKSSEFKRYMAESETATRKARKARVDEQKKKFDTLLFELEAKKKLKEQEKNLIDRDRLGFDDESFIGEPYHGQKRKKKHLNNE